MDGAAVVPSMSFLQRLDPRQWFAIESGNNGTGEFSFTPNFSLDELPTGLSGYEGNGGQTSFI